MSKELIDAIRSGTAEDIVAAVTKSHLYNQTNVLAEAIVAAREEPEDTPNGTVTGENRGRGLLVIRCDSRRFSPGDRVTITRKPRNDHNYNPILRVCRKDDLQTRYQFLATIRRRL